MGIFSVGERGREEETEVRKERQGKEEGRGVNREQERVNASAHTFISRKGMLLAIGSWQKRWYIIKLSR